MLSKLSIVAATTAILMILTPASAEPRGERGGGPGMRGGGPGMRGGGNVHINRNVTVNRHVAVNRHFGGGGPVVGGRYHGGVWYGTGRRFWRGQWYPYGVGSCWLFSPIGYVWVCG